MKVLILCTGNSCRSQMAEGFLKALDKSLVVCSAGTKPAGRVNPHAVLVMNESDIDISKHTSDNVLQYISEEWDYVISVCGSANETCPVFTGKVRHRIHKGFDDPYEAKGTETEIINEYRRVRDEIKIWINEFYNSCLQSQD